MRPAVRSRLSPPCKKPWNREISRLFRCLPPSVKLHKPQSLWNLYGIRLECLLESPFYRPVPYISARHFQNFFAYFRISEKNIFLGISSSSVIFEKYFFKSPNFFWIFCFFSLLLSLYGILHSFLGKVKIENNHNHRPCRWFALAPLGHDPGWAYRLVEKSANRAVFPGCP